MPQVISNLWQICGSEKAVADLWQLLLKDCGRFMIAGISDK
ncbi:MAG: hypothetical protein ACLRRQ_09615 [Lachnospira pectinoschiza]